MADFDQELQRIFQDELAESLDELAGCLELLRHETEATPELLAETLRRAHNIKGAARTAGQEPIVEITHEMEEVISGLRDSTSPVPALTVRMLLEGVALLELVSAGKAGEQEAVAWIETVRSQMSLGAAKKKSKRRASRDEPRAPRAVESAAAKEAKEQSTSLRISVDRLDRMMADAEELLARHGRAEARREALEAMTVELVRAAAELPVKHGQNIKSIAARLEQLGRCERKEIGLLNQLVEQVRSSMKGVRMLPLAALLPKLRSVVRECALEVGNDVRLVDAVGDVELDRKILEAVSDPLMHLLRNAVGHGIETAKERKIAKKPSHGVVELRASLIGQMVQLEISDDGKGIDRERVIAEARRKGMIDSEKMSDNESALDELLLSDGFSTVEHVDRLSGRGVGLGIVRRRLTELGGVVDVVPRGRLGGASFRLTLPASLVSTQGLLVEAGAAACMIPLEYIERTARLEISALRNIEGGCAVSLEGRDPIRLRWLSSLLGHSRSADPSFLTVVVLAAGERRLGLVVEEILGKESYMIKPLPWNLEHVEGFSGAVLLGGGEIAPVVDVSFLLRRGVAVAESTLPRSEQARPKVLVVDDSLTSRALESNILREAGYEVITAVDGAQAWRCLHDVEVDVVVSDIQMPEMDGLELTSRLRNDDKLKNLPVILVTSLGNESDVAKGAQIGADEYIVKGDFDQHQLLDAVARLI